MEASHHTIGPFGSQRPTGGPISGQLNLSTMSFKIVTECPLIIMVLFQLYSHYVQTNIHVLLPLMVTVISIPGPQHVSPKLKNHYVELKSAQVKTVSFLTYLLRSFADYIRPHEESISKSIVNLLVSCPDSVLIRKELLVATRHVLATEFRRGFFQLIDTLLEERVLVGTGRACFETLRPLAYSILAELIHHVRLDLSFSQLSEIIYLFSRNTNDSSLPFSVQTTCARLMLNLVEPIFRRCVDPVGGEESRALLGHILDAFVSKFGTLKHTISQLIEDCEGGKEHCNLRSKLELPTQAASKLQIPLEHSKELSECKQLIKTLVIGMKTLLCSITNVNLPHMQVSQLPIVGSPLGLKGMREEEVRVASRVLKNGVLCLPIFKEKDEEREMLQCFSQIFIPMEPRNLMDMFAMCMQHLFDCMLNNRKLLVDLGPKTKTQHMAERSIFKVLLMTIIAASAEPELQNPKDDFVPNICRHFAMIFHVNSLPYSPSLATSQAGGPTGIGGFSFKSKSSSNANLKDLDPSIFLDALVDVLADENRAHAKAALNGLNIFSETLLILAHTKHTGILNPSREGSPGTPVMVLSPSKKSVCLSPTGVQIPVFEQLLHQLLHCCYKSTWQAKMGGVMGLGVLVGKATVETLRLFQVRAVRGLVYVLKWLPEHAHKEQEETAQVLKTDSKGCE